MKKIILGSIIMIAFTGRLFSKGLHDAGLIYAAESPSKIYSYRVEEKNENYYVTINMGDKIIFSDNQAYRKRDRFYIAWHQTDDTLWVYSGDIGLYYFVYINGNWIKNTWIADRDDGLDIPSVMKNAVPILKQLMKN
jgi:hypothetical protein